MGKQIIPSQTTMEKTLFKRRDIVNNFPKSFSFTALKDHLSREYLSVVGCHVDDKCLKYLVESFMLMWKATKNKEKVFSTPRGNAWLEKKLPMPLDLPAIPQCVTPKEAKLRKPHLLCTSDPYLFLRKLQNSR